MPCLPKPNGWARSLPRSLDRAVLALCTAPLTEHWIHENWLSDAPLREWYGIETDDNGRVTGLILDGNNLAGEIPPELADLADLEVLNLHYNNLTGDIPRELGSLSNLTALVLGENQLGGGLPSELGNFVNLTLLGLEKNN